MECAASSYSMLSQNGVPRMEIKTERADSESASVYDSCYGNPAKRVSPTPFMLYCTKLRPRAERSPSAIPCSRGLAPSRAELRRDQGPAARADQTGFRADPKSCN